MEKALTSEQLQWIQDYLQGNLSKESKESFEKALLINPVLREEFDIQKKLINSLNEDSMDWEFTDTNSEKKELEQIKKQFSSKQIQGVSQSIQSIAQEHRLEQSEKDDSTSSIRKYLWLAGVASILVLCILAFRWYMHVEQLDDSMYSNWITELPSFQVKSDLSDVLSNMENAFVEERYQEVLNVSNSIQADHDYYPFALMYRGAAYHKLDQNEQALDVFDKLYNLQIMPESSMALWFKWMVFNEENNTTEMKKIAEIILQDKQNYNYIKAKEWLEKQ